METYPFCASKSGLLSLKNLHLFRKCIILDRTPSDIIKRPPPLFAFFSIIVSCHAMLLLKACWSSINTSYSPHFTRISIALVLPPQSSLDWWSKAPRLKCNWGSIQRPIEPRFKSLQKQWDWGLKSTAFDNQKHCDWWSKAVLLQRQSHCDSWQVWIKLKVNLNQIEVAFESNALSCLNQIKVAFESNWKSVWIKLRDYQAWIEGWSQWDYSPIRAQHVFNPSQSKSFKGAAQSTASVD